MKTLNAKLIVPASVVLALAGSALAQSAGGGDFDKPLKTQQRWSPVTTQPGNQARSTTIMRQQDDGDDYELKIENGEISAKINGKAVPKDRIRSRGQGVEILGEDGEVATRFQVQLESRRGIHAPPVPPQPPTGMAIPMAPAAPLKVMLGIRMAVPDAEMQEELDLDEGEGVLVEEVIDGQPAQKAGLKDGDVIIEFDGESPVTAATVREVLEQKDVGDTLNLTVLREGESKRLKVKLAEYDPSKFAMPELPSTFGGGNFQVQPIPGMDEEAMQKLMEEHMKQFKGRGQGGLAPRVWGPGEEGMQFFVPGNGDAPTRAKLQELEGRMKDLDKKLERLSDQLDRLQKQLEKSGN